MGTVSLTYLHQDCQRILATDYAGSVALAFGVFDDEDAAF